MNAQEIVDRCTLAPSGCWEWEGARSYGQTMFEGRLQRAHRIMWILLHGPVSTEQFVCHHCDNPPCVNPDHLFLGTIRDNLQDMHRKARGGTCKLSNEQVVEIRSSFPALGRGELAKHYGVTRSQINRILRNEQRRHV